MYLSPISTFFKVCLRFLPPPEGSICFFICEILHELSTLTVGHLIQGRECTGVFGTLKKSCLLRPEMASLDLWANQNSTIADQTTKRMKRHLLQSTAGLRETAESGGYSLRLLSHASGRVIHPFVSYVVSLAVQTSLSAIQRVFIGEINTSRGFLL